MQCTQEENRDTRPVVVDTAASQVSLEVAEFIISMKTRTMTNT